MPTRGVIATKLQGCSVLLLGVLAAVSACSDKKHPGSAPGPDAGGSVAGKPPLVSGGEAQQGGVDSGGSESASAGQSPGSGEGGDSGVGEAGATSTAMGGAAPDPIPPVGDPPVCVHERTFAQGGLLALSAAGDDLLQAVTPTESTIAWKNGDHFYIADWDEDAEAFGAPLEVAGGAQYSAVSLSPDGLVLIGVTHELSVLEQTRAAGAAFADADPGAGDFEEFNATLATIPVANQVLADAVVSADEASFFFSHFSSTYSGSYASVYESHRSGGVWSFSSSDLGKSLYGSEQKRRVPTGVSSDSLTLFYFDQVSGDFRAAWRVNTQVPFNYSEVLALGTGTKSAAPNAACTRIYFSAQGANGLDLFVSSVGP